MFELVSKYTPKGDQEAAINKILDNFNHNFKEQVLLGATGTGKTFTIANIIKSLNKKTLVIAPNKTLAGQLYSELKALFPNNRVEYFISYYDYYQPEAYVVASDTYIEKDAQINDEIDKLRHSATQALLSSDDVIVVASVSCIYGIGDVDSYLNATIFLRKGDKLSRNNLINRLVTLLYTRNDYELKRGTFRVKGDVIEIIPISEKAKGIRIAFDFDEISEINLFDTLTNKTISNSNFETLFPATHFVTSKDKLEEAIRRIRLELKDQLKYFRDNNYLLEAERLESKTNYDIAMLEELGFCSGVENYSRHLSLKEAGATPSTLIDFFKNDFLLVIDESHITIPQIKGMYNGDRARKETLVNYGFRLPSALDNRPLKFKEFENKKDQVLYLSATPGDYELSLNIPIIEQIIRPTYILDPEIIIRPINNQIEDLFFEIKKTIANNEKALVTTLTIRMSEELTKYLQGKGIKVCYLHSKIKSLERMKILRDLRAGKYDCIVGINLLREGLDLPEVSLVGILDADKEGFLRSSRSLIQTAGRAARNVNGKVILYADKLTNSINDLVKNTARRRQIQQAYNLEHNLVPKTIIKPLPELISNIDLYIKKNTTEIDKIDLDTLYKDMLKAADNLDFEKAIALRDIYFEAKKNNKE